MVARFVFAADPAGVALVIEQIEQERIVDLARPWLMTAGIVGDLDVRPPPSFAP